MKPYIVEETLNENLSGSAVQQKEVNIPEELQDTIQSLFVQSLHQHPKHVLPSLACTFIIALERNVQVEVSDPHFKKIVTFDNGCFIGPHDRTFFLRSSRPSRFMIVVFYPGQFFSLFRVPCSQLQNSIMHLSNASSKEIVVILDHVLNTACPNRQITLVSEFLEQTKREADKQKEIYFEMFDTLFQSMLYTEDETRVKDLCHTLQVNQKRAERVFQRYVGFNPKSFLRLKRYMHALYTLCYKGEELDCKDIARLCGYHDLPHMINEFKNLSGYTPASIDRNFLHRNVLYVENVWYNSYSLKLSMTGKSVMA